MSFDGTIHLGDLVTLLVVVAAATLNYATLGVKVNLMYKWFEKHVLNGKHGD